MKVFKEIFNLNSSKGKMSKSQLLDFINETNEKLDNDEEKKINNYFIFNDIFLTFEVFWKLYADLFKNNSSIFWKIFDKLGYNNLLDKKDSYDLDYLQTHLDEFQGLE